MYRAEKERNLQRAAKTGSLTLEQLHPQDGGLLSARTSAHPLMPTSAVLSKCCCDTLEKLSTEKVTVRVLRAGVGGAITESGCAAGCRFQRHRDGLQRPSRRNTAAAAEQEKWTFGFTRSSTRWSTKSRRRCAGPSCACLQGGLRKARRKFARPSRRRRSAPWREVWPWMAASPAMRMCAYLRDRRRRPYRQGRPACAVSKTSVSEVRSGTECGTDAEISTTRGILRHHRGLGAPGRSSLQSRWTAVVVESSPGGVAHGACALPQRRSGHVVKSLFYRLRLFFNVSVSGT